jgi:hypothetical protein
MTLLEEIHHFFDELKAKLTHAAVTSDVERQVVDTVEKAREQVIDTAKTVVADVKTGAEGTATAVEKDVTNPDTPATEPPAAPSA